MFYGKGRRKCIDGTYADIYIDPLLDDLPWSYQCLERPYNVSHRRPAATDNLRYTDLIEYAGVIGETLGIGTVSLTKDEQSMLREIAAEFESRIGVEPKLVDLVRSDLSKRRIRFSLFKRLLSRADPNLALLVSSYLGRETFVEACQATGTPVAELQHGVIHRYHMGYSFPGENKSAFPDYFFSFGDFWSDMVDLPVPDEDVYSIGYPHLERQYQNFANLENTEQVVFISQARIGDQLSRLATELSDNPAFDDDIVYKLHPKEFNGWRERYPWLVEADLEVVTDDPPLYQVFSESTAQVGVNSTALFEGLKFGLDTYVFERPGSEYMEHLLENNYAASFESVEDFFTTYRQWPTGDGAVETEYFFESDGISNFHRAVGEIVEGR